MGTTGLKFLPGEQTISCHGICLSKLTLSNQLPRSSRCSLYVSPHYSRAKPQKPRKTLGRYANCLMTAEVADAGFSCEKMPTSGLGRIFKRLISSMINQIDKAEKHSFIKTFGWCFTCSIADTPICDQMIVLSKTAIYYTFFTNLLSWIIRIKTLSLMQKTFTITEASNI